MAAQRSFVWQGVDAANRRVSGEADAPSARFLRARLRRQGISAARIRPRTQRKSARTGRTGRAGASAIAQLSRQIATLLEAGLPLVQAFDILGGDFGGNADARPVAAIARRIAGELATGATLATALARFPAQFDPLYRNLVDVGEQSGTLEAMLHRLATCQERAAETRRTVKKALTYPLLVVAAALLVAALMLIHVVPQFETVFASVGAELPTATRAVIRISDFAQAWWWAVLGAAGALAATAAAILKRSASARDAASRLVLKLPIAGMLVSRSASARVARTLSVSIGAGMPLVDALHAVAGAAGNSVFARAVRNARDDVAAGRTLAAALDAQDVFPAAMLRMVSVGEESGRVDDMLSRVADQFESQAANAVERLTSLIEPLTMAVLGLLVGGLVVAMYLPVFQLGAAFGG